MLQTRSISPPQDVQNQDSDCASLDNEPQESLACEISRGRISAPLPAGQQELRRLVEAYFTNIHPLRCLSFVHKPSFMRAVDRGEVREEFGDALVHIMCAFGSR